MGTRVHWFGIYHITIPNGFFFKNHTFAKNIIFAFSNNFAGIRISSWIDVWYLASKIWSCVNLCMPTKLARNPEAQICSTPALHWSKINCCWQWAEFKAKAISNWIQIWYYNFIRSRPFVRSFFVWEYWWHLELSL